MKKMKEAFSLNNLLLGTVRPPHFCVRQRLVSPRLGTSETTIKHLQCRKPLSELAVSSGKLKEPRVRLRTFVGAEKSTQTFLHKAFRQPFGSWRPRRKSWMSAPKSAFSCGPGGGEKLSDPWALSCTRLRVPPVALHVSQLISWIL